jgi:hypothetical protein
MSTETMTRRKRGKPKRKKSDVVNGSNGSNGHAEAPAEAGDVSAANPEAPHVEPGVEVPAEEAPSVESPPAASLFEAPIEPPFVEAPPLPAEVSMEDMVSSMTASPIIEIDHAPNAVGWTSETMKVFKRSKEIYELGLQIDREVAHLVMGIIAIHLGDFDVVSLNFQSCGIVPQQATAQQSAVQQAQQPGRKR